MSWDWQPMETAPKGGGAELVTDPAWVNPPEILLRFAEHYAVGFWDSYYAVGGRGFDGHELRAWREPLSGESLVDYYDEPLGWCALPSTTGEGGGDV